MSQDGDGATGGREHFEGLPTQHDMQIGVVAP